MDRKVKIAAMRDEIEQKLENYIDTHDVAIQRLRAENTVFTHILSSMFVDVDAVAKQVVWAASEREIYDRIDMIRCVRAIVKCSLSEATYAIEKHMTEK